MDATVTEGISATEDVELARIAATAYARQIGCDASELLSAAWEGVMSAHRTWKGRGTFRGFALTLARQFIYQSLRQSAVERKTEHIGAFGEAEK